MTKNELSMVENCKKCEISAVFVGFSVGARGTTAQFLCHVTRRDQWARADLKSCVVFVHGSAPSTLALSSAKGVLCRCSFVLCCRRVRALDRNNRRDLCATSTSSPGRDSAYGKSYFYQTIFYPQKRINGAVWLCADYLSVCPPTSPYNRSPYTLCTFFKFPFSSFLFPPPLSTLHII